MNAKLFQSVSISLLGLLPLLALCANLNSQTVTYKGCTVDAEIWKLPACAIEIRDGKLFLASRYLTLFRYDGPFHYAWTSLAVNDWVYFNSHGEVVVQNVATIDNGPSAFHHGLVRVVKGEKWGLSNFKGQLIVPMTYDGIGEPDQRDRHWSACHGCKTVHQGEYAEWVGGEWVELDWNGREIAKTPNRAPTQPK